MDTPASDGQARWRSAVPLTEVPSDGTGVTVDIGGHPVALFVQGGRVFAVDDACPHAGGSLGMGIAQGAEVTCPWHGMHFDLETGASTDGLDDCTRVHRTRINDDGGVEVALLGVPV
jgi:nitrite reductase/ring-hydroxylating ferredoxin subunit